MAKNYKNSLRDFALQATVNYRKKFVFVLACEFLRIKTDDVSMNQSWILIPFIDFNYT